ncbi:MAG: HAMP domain-containing histidine kinase [Clostridiales bacterium]|nr:HAMP domain-containing histidine kinase [Clostridiales bacterium]
MKLKHRLIIAFLIMIAMPVILISITAGTIVRFQMDSIHESYDVEAKTIQVITNPIQILNRITRGVYNEIKLYSISVPERLCDIDYYKELDIQLEPKHSFLAVRKEDKFVYVGNEEKLSAISGLLPDYGSGTIDIDGGIYLGGSNPFLVKMQDFTYTDGTNGTIFVITDLNVLMPQVKAVAIQSAISFIVILFLTASLLIFWIYRSILKPLNVLRVATNHIKEGDLGYSVTSVSEDEIGELCNDFEGMRVRLKELIDDRLQYEEDIKELISNISHDLKTPLTAIKGYAEGLLDGVADTSEKQEKYLKTIYMKANDMTSLVDELGYYAKIDANTIPYTFKNINMTEYFEDCIEDLHLELEVKNIKINYENLIDPKVQIVADAEQLKRVIHNIIGNSVKYMDKPLGIITIKIQDLGEYVEVDIEDNGAGISQEELPYIFDRFYRADVSRNTYKGGSGLGLAIAKKVIEDHSGTIWATSEKQKGTTISFTLKKYHNG